MVKIRLLNDRNDYNLEQEYAVAKAMGPEIFVRFSRMATVANQKITFLAIGVSNKYQNHIKNLTRNVQYSNLKGAIVKDLTDTSIGDFILGPRILSNVDQITWAAYVGIKI